MVADKRGDVLFNAVSQLTAAPSDYQAEESDAYASGKGVRSMGDCTRGACPP